MIRRAKTKGSGLVVTSHDDELKNRQISPQLSFTILAPVGPAPFLLENAFPDNDSLNVYKFRKDSGFSCECADNAQMEPYHF